MTIPNKDDIIHERDGDNELIPRKVELETLSDTAKRGMNIDPEDSVEFEIKPATQGELAELSEKAAVEEEDLEDESEMTNVETEFVAERILKPDVSPDDLEYLRNPEVAGAALVALISESTGVPQDEVQDNIQEAIEEDQDGQMRESFQEDEGEDEAEAEDGENEEESEGGDGETG